MKPVGKHTVSCIVKNRSGVLSTITGSFGAKGINITSLAVGETEDGSRSRMTIVVVCDEQALADMVVHLRHLDDVLDVEGFQRTELIERELVLIKVHAEGQDIARIMQAVEVFRATIAGMGKDSLVVEMAGPAGKVDALVNLLKPFGILETVRTGRVVMGHNEDTDAGA